MNTLAPTEISAGAAPQAVLLWAYETFPRVVIVASFQAESSVLIDMASRIRPDAKVLTLDTGRLPQQTYDMIDRVRGRDGIDVQVISPAANHLQATAGSQGVNLVFSSA